MLEPNIIRCTMKSYIAILSVLALMLCVLGGRQTPDKNHHASNKEAKQQKIRKVTNIKQQMVKFAYVGSRFKPSGIEAVWGNNSFNSVRLAVEHAQRDHWAGERFKIELPSDLIFQANGTNSTQLVEFVRSVRQGCLYVLRQVGPKITVMLRDGPQQFA